ncbi:hypothetical protein [Bowmanella sp. JS7-9]|uniref:Membrane protein involved in the export of O-antigen and teichoic acid n=1 Tax=Pseudobowmanella zhangzhouensis TaxID=1537679 RepID=A0ABW1XKB3_9ALTE|nr:hypothetical protein [Bowmanella sp. JS7-9]
MSGSLVGNLLTVIAGILIARSVLPDERGDIAKIFMYAQVFILFCTFAASDYLVVKGNSKHTFMMLIMSGFPLTIFATFISLSTFNIFDYADSVSSIYYLVYFILFFPVYYLRSICLAHLAYKGKAKQVAAERSVYGLFYILVLVAMFIFSSINVGVVILSSLFAEVLSTVYVFNRVKASFYEFRFDIGFKPLWICNNFKQFLSFSMSVASKNVDKLVVFIFVSSYLAGIYVVASALPAMLTQFYSKASQDVIFVQSKLNSKLLMSSLRPLYLMSLILLLSIMFSNLFGQEFIVIVFGEDYKQSADYLSLLFLLGYLISVKEFLLKLIKPHFVDFVIKAEVAYLLLLFSSVYILSSLSDNDFYHLIFGMTVVVGVSAFAVMLVFVRLVRTQKLV